MPANDRPGVVLVISNISWDFVWQRHQTMASLFARSQAVLFCEIPGIRRVRLSDLSRLLAHLRVMLGRPAGISGGNAVPKELRLLRPFVLPATNVFFCAFNAWQIRRLVRNTPELAGGVDLIFNYSASRTALRLISLIPHRQLVYDCTDDWLAVKGIPKFLSADEQILLQRADLTLVPSRTLFARKSPLARRCIQLPHGALVDRFELPVRPLPSDLGNLALLYYGHLHRQHLDFELIEGIARARPGWRIVLVGPVKTPHIFPANVELPGQQPHEELRRFVGQADVLLLPYVLNSYTEAVMPAKTYECLATGCPVVATPLPELVAELTGCFTFAIGVDAWVQAIEQVARNDSEPARQARVTRAKANSWESRFEELRGLLDNGRSE